VSELTHQAKLTKQVHDEVAARYGMKKIPHLYGTMIEIPRAALRAGEIAEATEFFSFGTNDLTQMAYGFSRDDIGAFVPAYVEKKLLPADPFQILDPIGVGELIDLGIKRGRATKPNLKVGICGEHGGEPSSVKFCHKVGMNYVSCSPFRVPIARLAAAQAVAEEKAARPKRAGRKVEGDKCQVASETKQERDRLRPGSCHLSLLPPPSSLVTRHFSPARR
jgi:pyruvate,orthophosphate dikinase